VVRGWPRLVGLRVVHIVCRSRRSPLDRDDPGGPGPRRRGTAGSRLVPALSRL